MTAHRAPEAGAQYDTVIAGAGAAGLFAAYALLRRAPGARVLIADAGPSLVERERAASAELGGLGGAGLYLGGRLYLGPAAIPAMPPGVAPAGMRPVLEGERYLTRAREVDAIFAGLGATSALREGPDARMREALEQARAAGLDYVVSYPVRLLGVDERRGVLRALIADLESRGVSLFYGTLVSGAQRARVGFRVALSAAGDGQMTASIVTTKTLVLAPGRYGAEWLVRSARELDAEVVALPRAYGVRIEARANAFQPLTDVNPDPRLQLALGDDAMIKTYATCPGGRVTAVERYGRTVASGVPVSVAERGPNTTTALLLQPGVDGAKGRWQGGEYVAGRLSERTPGKLTVQRLGDLRRGEATTAGALAANAVRATDGDAVPGAMRDAYPEAYWEAMERLLERLDRLAQGVAGDDTLIYGPTEEHFWHFPTDEHLQTTAAGLFVAGDGPGQSQGVVQAGVAGLLAGEGIAATLAK